MAIEKSTRFTTDTQGNVQSSIPLIIIYKTINSSNISEIDNVAESDKLYISTNNIYFDGNYYEPLLNKQPNIKQSIDTENKNLRIQTNSIEINNAQFHGRVFSDYLVDINNCIIRIYFKTQSCKTLDDCLLVSQSVITKYKQRGDIVSIDTEDSTEPILSQKIPELAEGTDFAFSDQLKPIPIVYGHVTKSPVRKNINPFESDSEGNEAVMSLICDSKPIYNIAIEDKNQIYPIINQDNKTFRDLFYHSPVYVYDENYLNIINEIPEDYYLKLSQESDVAFDETPFFEFSNNKVLVTPNYFAFQEALSESESLGGLDLDSAIISRIWRKFTDISGQKKVTKLEVNNNAHTFNGALYATTDRTNNFPYAGSIGTNIYFASAWKEAMFDEENYITQSEAYFPFESDVYDEIHLEPHSTDSGLENVGDEAESSIVQNWNVPNPDGSFSVFNLNPKNYMKYIYNDDNKALCWAGVGLSNAGDSGTYVNWEFKLDDLGIDNKCITKAYFDMTHWKNPNEDYGESGFGKLISGSIFWATQAPTAFALRIKSFDDTWEDLEFGQEDWRKTWNTIAPVEDNHLFNIQIDTTKLSNNRMQSSTSLGTGVIATEWNTVGQFKSLKIGQPKFDYTSSERQATLGALNYLHIIQDAFIEKPNEKDWYVNVKGRVDENILWTPFNSWELNTFTSDELSYILDNISTTISAQTIRESYGYNTDLGSSNDTSGGDSGWLINTNQDITCDELINSMEFDVQPEWIWVYTKQSMVTEYNNLTRTNGNQTILENDYFIIFATDSVRVKTYSSGYKFIRMNHIVGTANDWEQGFTPQEAQDKVNQLYIQNGWKDYIYTPESYMVETPALVIKHLLENETTIETETFDVDMLHKSIATHQGWRMAFTINEQQEIKEIVQDLSQNTKLYPKFTPEGKFGYATIKNYYNASDVKYNINKEDVINYSFETTKNDEIYNSHEISYEFDYATEEYNKLSKKNTIPTQNAIYNDYKEITEYLYQQMINLPDNWLYNVNKLYNKTIEEANNDVEAKYIRSTHTAELYKKYLLMEHINEHLIINLSTTNKYIDLDIGDIIYLDKLSEKTGLGYKYWSYEVKGGQLLYPFYIVTQVNKSKSKVDIKLRRLHRLQYGLPQWLIQNTILDTNYTLPNNISSISEVIDDGGVYNYAGSTNLAQQFEPIFEEYPADINNEFSLQWYPDQDSYILKAEEGSAVRLDVLQTQLYDTTAQNWNVKYQEKVDDVWVDYDLETPSFEFIVYANADNNYSGHVIVKSKQTNDTGLYKRGKIIITTNLGDTFTKEFYQDLQQDEEPVDNLLEGDVNYDGIVNVLDVVQTVQMILGNQDVDLVADLNGDGGVNIQDLIMIINKALGE